ncbi:5'-nucleotidase domain-containing protein 1 isoform X4 [Paroedura picta]|uniref:5'-nucleotidase domain-containing protein 1 isoform X4 n=1 Tax=Paroedura picta TaxID=143630 RepID=UPI004055FCD7
MARSFSLAACEVIGFDLDHTLCRYNLVESSQLIYESFAEFMVAEKGYDKELLNVPLESWDFCCKGLVLDMEDGNFLKLAQDGTILRASHGTKHLTSEEILEKYGRREWKHFKTMSGMVSRSAKYYVYDNYFDLPGALLCARIVDSLNQHNASQKYDFWKDMIAAIQHNYKTSAFKGSHFRKPCGVTGSTKKHQKKAREQEENCGTYFPEVKRNPDKYIQSCPESVKKWLRKLKDSGKILLLITSSHSDYCRLLCEHTLGNDFAELFDIVITNALKPGFFSQPPNQRPFRTLENDEEQEVLLSLDKPGWYSQGNSSHLYELLKKITGKLEPKGHHPKSLHAVSKQWGSYFVDTIAATEDAAETLVRTWPCKCVSAYSTITIPSIESIADLPLDYRFTRFSSKNSVIAGYFPNPPRSLSTPQPMATK